MIPDNTKWTRISQDVMRAGLSPCVRDGPACKTKWNQLIPDYKRIVDYFGRTGRNLPNYWKMSSQERKAEGLPKQFVEEFFHSIHEWYGSRPQIQPPHVRDLLASNDRNYQPRDSDEPHGEEDGSEPETEDPMDMADGPEANGDSTPQRSPQMTACRVEGTSRSTANPTTNPSSRPLRGVPAGVILHVISSSDTSQYLTRQRAGNTGVRWKSMSSHNMIAEATKATGVVMAQHMQDIAESSRDLERSKIEVQLKLFSEKMSYQREKDRRLYENAVIANENARLSILKQGEVVTCLTNLSGVLSRSLIMTSQQGVPKNPQAAARSDSTLDPSYCLAEKCTAPDTSGPRGEPQEHRRQSDVPTGDRDCDNNNNTI